MGLFGFLVSITHNSVSITHNSKTMRPMTQKLVWISITLFSVFVSITQFSDFWVMSYGNWKHILTVFSFHNSVFNGISINILTWWPPFTVSCLILQTISFFFFFFPLPLLFPSHSPLHTHLPLTQPILQTISFPLSHHKFFFSSL